MDEKLTKVLNKLNPNKLDKNYKLLSKEFNVLDLLERLVNDKYSEELSLIAIESILNSDLVRENINIIKFNKDKNFLFNSLNYRHNNEYFIKLFELAVNYGLDINCVDHNGDTILHRLLKMTPIRSNICNIIIPIYDLLIENNYDIFILNNKYESILDLAKLRTESIREELIKKINNDKKELLPLKVEKEKNKLDDRLLYISNDNFEYYVKKFYYDIPCYKLDEEVRLGLLEYLFSKQLIDINSEKYDFDFICKAINKNFSKDYIYKLLELSIKYGLDVNHISYGNYDYLMYIILYNNSLGNITPIFELLVANGFNVTKNTCDGTPLYYLAWQNNEYILDLDCFLKKVDSYFDNNLYVKDKTIKRITIDNNIPYEFILSNKNFNLISGKEKSGKTYLLNCIESYLTLKCSTHTYYTSLNDIISSCKSISEVKLNSLNIIRHCIETQKVLIIDDLDKLYRDNITKEEKDEIDSMIYNCIKDFNLKIIASCDKKNINLFKDSLLNDYIFYYEIYDPNENELDKIIDKILDEKIDFDLLEKDYNFDISIKKLVNKVIKYILSVKEYDDISYIKIIIEIINNINNYMVNIYKHSDCPFDTYFLHEAVQYAINKCYNDGFIKEEKRLEIIDELSNKMIELKYTKILRR